MFEHIFFWREFTSHRPLKGADHREFRVSRGYTRLAEVNQKKRNIRVASSVLRPRLWAWVTVCSLVPRRACHKESYRRGNQKKKTATMQTSVCEGVLPSGFGVTTLQLKKFKIPWLSRSLPRGANSTGKFDMRGQLKLAPFWIRAPRAFFFLGFGCVESVTPDTMAL